MRRQLSILFLIAFSPHPLFTNATQAALGANERPGVSLESDAFHKWAELVSLLDLANIAGKIQKASYLLGIPMVANADKVHPEAQKSPDNDPRPQQGFEIPLFSEEVSKIIRSFEAVIDSTVGLGMAFHDALESVSSDDFPSTDAPSTSLLKKVATLVETACDDFRARFPLPATAPGHAKRAEHVSEALEHLQQLIVRLAMSHKIEQEVIGRHLAGINPILRDMGVLIGDVAELYPAAIEALVLNISSVLLPEAVFVRSLVILYCLGPYVLGKDAVSGWLLRHVSKALKVGEL